MGMTIPPKMASRSSLSNGAVVNTPCVKDGESRNSSNGLSHEYRKRNGAEGVFLIISYA
jgi:hypothetical protein